MAWESDDTSVATVSTSGLVTAVARGTTTITATSGDKSKTASITVDLPAARIDVDPSSHTLTSVGATKQLTVTVYDANNDIITGAAVTWESGDTNVATVNSNGLVTAVADGSTGITATSGGESDSATITVDLPDGSIEIDPSSATLTAVADTVQLTATVYDANDDIVSGATVTWTSGTTSVATVSASGLVTAVARGNTTITATSGSVSDEAAITVDLPAKRIDINPSSVTLSSVGATEQLTATVYDANNDIITGATVAWTSSDSSVATVNTNGLVKAVANGTTNITARSDSVSESIEVTVLICDGDCAVLVILYNATDGENWKNSSNWLTDEPINNWYGVSTESGGRVTRLNLLNNDLDGTIPSAIGRLDSLRSLTMSGNDLSGSIPTAIGSLSSLGYLNLRGNELSGSIPSQLRNLSKLENLYLGSNKLTGGIPSSLGSLTNLRVLSIGSNFLGGTIPSQLGSLDKLEDLILNSNQLTGGIPSQLGSLSKLETLQLWSNSLDGSIPSGLGGLSELESLDLRSNDLTGGIPTQLGQLANLEQLNLDNNDLSGSIPSQLGNLSMLTRLSVPNNMLSGTIPSSLTNLMNLRTLKLSGNDGLSGCIPPSLHDVSSNDLDNLDLEDCEVEM